MFSNFFWCSLIDFLWKLDITSIFCLGVVHDWLMIALSIRVCSNLMIERAWPLILGHFRNDWGLEGPQGSPTYHYHCRIIIPLLCYKRQHNSSLLLKFAELPIWHHMAPVGFMVLHKSNLQKFKIPCCQIAD